MQNNRLKANYVWHDFSQRDQLINELATVMHDHIKLMIKENGRAIVGLSGGSTPKPLFVELAKRDIDWSKVIITLVDERWVDVGHPLSNAALVDDYLLSAIPSSATFIPLYQKAKDAESSLAAVLDEYCKSTESSLDNPAPIDLVILGMGGDGHTASFFPDANNIAEMIDPESGRYLYSCTSPSTQVHRITWSLSHLLRAVKILLHIEGESKKNVFQSAILDTDAQQLPIRSVIFQQHTPLQVYYAD
jgi:6-phosphogluconolactonase